MCLSLSKLRTNEINKATEKLHTSKESVILKRANHVASGIKITVIIYSVYHYNITRLCNHELLCGTNNVEYFESLKYVFHIKYISPLSRIPPHHFAWLSFLASTKEKRKQTNLAYLFISQPALRKINVRKDSKEEAFKKELHCESGIKNWGKKWHRNEFFISRINIS